MPETVTIADAAARVALVNGKGMPATWGKRPATFIDLLTPVFQRLDQRSTA